MSSWWCSSFQVLHVLQNKKFKSKYSNQFWKFLLPNLQHIKLENYSRLQSNTCTTPNWVCLGGWIGTARKYDFSLAVLINSQEMYIIWRFDKNRQENMQFSWQLGYAANFLGSLAKPPSKVAILLAILLNRQVNVQFLGSRLSRQVICFPWLISLAVWWPRKYLLILILAY